MKKEMEQNMSPISRQVRLFFDIETIGNEEGVGLLEMPKPSKTIKDPEKQEADIAQRYQELVDTAGLDPFLCEIRSIGWAIGQAGQINVDLVTKKVSETDVLEQFWDNFARTSAYCVGYNIMDFDLPVILARSMLLGVKPTMLPNLARYRSDPTCDLMWLLAGWNFRGAKKLKWVCKRLGIEIPAGDDNGSMVKDMTDKQLKVYSASDIKITQELYRRMNGYYFMH
jgi:predicted PolB exonuclease-like 3'-5' exonuclease